MSEFDARHSISKLGSINIGFLQNILNNIWNAFLFVLRVLRDTNAVKKKTLYCTDTNALWIKKHLNSNEAE